MVTQLAPQPTLYILQCTVYSLYSGQVRQEPVLVCSTPAPHWMLAVAVTTHLAVEEATAGAGDLGHSAGRGWVSGRKAWGENHCNKVVKGLHCRNPCQCQGIGIESTR